MKSSKLFCATFLILLLTGCAAMLVPETSDPAAKLNWAQELIDNQGRPIPAERLIRESIDIYQERNDELGLANAYRVYGLFFKSEGVNRMQKFYESNGFIDKSATYATRLEKSLEYLQKARVILEKQKNLDRMANIYMHIGFVYQIMKDKPAACSSYDKSLLAYKAMLADDPKSAVLLPPKYKSYDTFIADIKNSAACSG